MRYRSCRATGTRFSVNSKRNLLSHPTWRKCFSRVDLWGSIDWFSAESSVMTGRHKNEFHASLAESINVRPRTVFNGRKSKHAVHGNLRTPSKTLSFQSFNDFFDFFVSVKWPSIEIHPPRNLDKHVGNLYYTRVLRWKVRFSFIHTVRSRQ